MNDRMPPLSFDDMTAAQRKAADELISGPRKGVFGPFVPLLRAPELMERLQKVGEYLRFHSSLESRLSEFVMLIIAREWTQQFEWGIHVPLAQKAGVSEEIIRAIGEGHRPLVMKADEEVVYDFCDELLRTKGVCDFTYQRTVAAFGEHGVIDILGVAGYFITVSMVMNVAHTPPSHDAAVNPLRPFPY